jgi:PAS domain S-box-containing protein
VNVLDRFNRHYRLLATGLVAPLVAALILFPFRSSFPQTSYDLLLVLVVVGVASAGDRFAGWLAALSAGLCFGFFLARPYLGLHITSAADLHTTLLLLVVGIAVTEIAHRGREAAKYANRMAAVVEYSGDAIIGRGLDDAITSWNPAAERILGYSSQEIIGKSADVLIPKDRPGEAKAIGAKVSAGKSVEHLETTRVRKDGAVIPVSITVSPIRDVDGAIVGTSTIARDRSEQVRADRMLADTSRQYRLLAENASDLVVMTSPDSVITWVSPSLTRSLGWAVEDLMGSRLLDLVHPDAAAAAAGSREAVHLGATPAGGFLMRFRSKSGQYRWMSGVTTPVTDESGVVTGVVSGLRDVEDLVQAREEAQVLSNALKTSNDSLRDFVAVASHDLRSPLVTIGGFATILTDNWAKLSEEDRLKHLGAIKRGVDRLSRLTNDLLTSAKVEGEAEQTRPEHIRLATAIDSYLQANRDELGTVGVTCPPELVAVVDPSHLTRILDNYVGNAFKYGDPPICIEAELVGDLVELRVRDHGPGVPPEFVSRLFTKFSRADTPTTRATQGTGLGLSIVKALAEANHGDARYQQDEPSDGCFVVRLPAAVA